jgi:hypothetical protein
LEQILGHYKQILNLLLLGSFAGCISSPSNTIKTASEKVVEHPLSISGNPIEAHFANLINRKVAPNVYDQKVRPDGIAELYIEGEPYEGKPTRIFALYKEAEKPIVLASGKSPAVVLVHGGGGSAFSEWVKKWNDAGFSAISIAVEGQTDSRPENTKKGWLKHQHGGPSRAGIYNDGKGNNIKPLKDQWMFHATTATVRAQQFLAAQPHIDKEHIGITGISWGGVITSTVIGFNSTFDFAIPIYGCGFLDGMDNQYGNALEDNQSYKKVWEPGLRLHRYENPSLWLNWRNDVHFALDGHAKNYGQLTQPYSVTIKPSMKHGHGAGWRQPESYLFAQQVVTKENIWGLPLETKQIGAGNAYAKYRFNLTDVEYKVKEAVIHYTSGTGHTGQSEWLTKPAKYHSTDANTYEATFSELPGDVKHWFINLRVDVKSSNQLKAATHTLSSQVMTN